MKIVVVEDVPMVRERIVDALQELPGIHVVGEADSVDTALSAIKELNPEVVLLDISLPGSASIKNGIGVLGWVKQRYPGMQVVMLTNHAGNAYREACHRAGALAFLDKSNEFEQLLSLLSKLIKVGERKVQQNAHHKLHSPAHEIRQTVDSLSWLGLLIDLARLIRPRRVNDGRWEQMQN